MQALTVHLFPDSREGCEERIREVNASLRGGVREGVIGLQTGFQRVSFAEPYPVVWEARTLGVGPGEILKAVASAGWFYPALVVYRQSKDPKWSHVLLPRLEHADA